MSRGGWVITLVLLCACARTDEPVSRIVLERWPCLGICPSYRVAISADGTVEYEGIGYLDTLGPRDSTRRLRRGSSRITRSSFAALASAFDRAWSRSGPNRYSHNQPTCPSPATDNPTLFIVREQGVRRDTMEVYYGCFGAPERIDRLGIYIDSVIGVGRWLGPPPRL